MFYLCFEIPIHRGRKKTLSASEISSLKVRVADGDKKAQIARDMGISRQTLYRYLRS
ncbi:MAG: helix-turn-helix domain-containing protein [Endozoicomonas sp.]|uniref:helix-turn-helix domain-containing protein n=1 Tax=Endozoicomonas sp. TaxID=1892382 RepID=UPI003D9B5CA4